MFSLSTYWYVTYPPTSRTDGSWTPQTAAPPDSSCIVVNSSLVVPPETGLGLSQEKKTSTAKSILSYMSEIHEVQLVDEAGQKGKTSLPNHRRGPLSVGGSSESDGTAVSKNGKRRFNMRKNTHPKSRKKTDSTQNNSAKRD
jgi:hypothetical protein